MKKFPEFVSYDTVMRHMHNPGNGEDIHIGFIDGEWCPLDICEEVDGVLMDPDEIRILAETQYGKTWLAVETNGVCDGYIAGYIAFAELIELYAINKMLPDAEPEDENELPEETKMNNMKIEKDGITWYGFADPDYPEKHGITTDFIHIVDPKSVFLDPEDLKRAMSLEKEAMEDAKAFSKGYDAWENSWIDGPGNGPTDGVLFYTVDDELDCACNYDTFHTKKKNCLLPDIKLIDPLLHQIEFVDYEKTFLNLDLDGDPSTINIGTIDGEYFPAGLCSGADKGIFDPDGRFFLPKSEYGETWIAVDSHGVIDEWEAGLIATSYLNGNMFAYRLISYDDKNEFVFGVAFDRKDAAKMLHEARSKYKTDVHVIHYAAATAYLRMCDEYAKLGMLPSELRAMNKTLRDMEPAEEDELPF